jgi:hypothetical protein
MSIPNAPFIFNASVPSGGGGATPVFILVNGTAVSSVVLDGTTALPVSQPNKITTEFNFIKSDGGPVTMTANPQVDACTVVGKTIVITGTSDTDTVMFVDGNGLLLNGNWTAKNGSMITIYWDGTMYREASRNDI